MIVGNGFPNLVGVVLSRVSVRFTCEILRRVTCTTLTYVDDAGIVRGMSTETRKSLDEVIDELHRSAARNIAMAEWVKAEKPWLRHDERIYKERAQMDLLAAQHLLEEL